MNMRTISNLDSDICSMLQVHKASVLKWLLDQNLDLSSVDDDGNNLLHLLCMPKKCGKDSVWVIQTAISSGVDLLAKNHLGFSPLMLGVLMLPLELAEMVLENVAKCDALDPSINESLLLAATYERVEIVASFFKRGYRIFDSSPVDSHALRVAYQERHRVLISKIDNLVGRFPGFDREVARKVDLQGHELEKLSSSLDKRTRKAVVLHPNCPTELLLKLAPDFPREFYKNPSFDWILFENPDLLFEDKRSVLKRILSLRDCPESFLRWAAQNGNDAEKLVLVRRPDVGGDLLKILAKDARVKAGAIALAKSPEALPDELYAALGHDDFVDRLLSVHPNAGPDLLGRLAQSCDAEVRKNVFVHRNASEATRKQLTNTNNLIHRLM